MLDAVVAAEEVLADFGGKRFPAAGAAEGAALLQRLPGRVAEGTGPLAVLALLFEVPQAVDQPQRGLEEVLDELRRLPVGKHRQAYLRSVLTAGLRNKQQLLLNFVNISQFR